MPQADVLTLVDDLAGLRSDGAALAETAARSRYYADVVYEAGLMRERVCNAAFVATTQGTAEYTQPASAIRALMVLYDTQQLRPSGRRALESYDTDWRSNRGRPLSFAPFDEDIHVYRLVPVPAASSVVIGGTTPFDAAIGGVAFPTDALTFIYTDNATDVLAWDELWVALEVLGREFGRESDHFDLLFSTTARQIASLLRALVGYENA